jgi:monothiol glutaredoxin
MQERLDRLVAAAPVFAFVVGSPLEPTSDESKALVAQLRALGVLFSAFDMAPAPELAAAVQARWGAQVGEASRALLFVERQVFPNWRDGAALMRAVPEASKGMTEAEALHEHCVELTRSAPVVVFMKGNVERPRCGFSNQMLTLLMGRGVTFATVDILADEQVRTYMKTLSAWPTFPQLYVGGKFVGGLDVAKELDAEGELAAMIPAEAKK